MKKVIKEFFFFLSPFLIYQVTGNSMIPSFYPKQKIGIIKKDLGGQIKKDDVVVLKDPRNNTHILKRIQQIKQNRYYVIGDNKEESTDSRDFGWIEKKDIIGKVIYHFSL